jgi:hypothetical protein
MPPADHETTDQFYDPQIRDGLVVVSVSAEETEMSATWSERLVRLQHGGLLLPMSSP